jgi:hypothetical protein
MTRKNSLNKGTIWKEVGFILVVIEKKNRKGKSNTCIKQMTKEKKIITIRCTYYGREEARQKEKI